MFRNLQQFEASVWPKIFKWTKESGENPGSSKTFASLVKNFYDNLMDAIKTGYIVEVEKASYSYNNRIMKIKLANGTEHTIRLAEVPKYGWKAANTDWKKEIGLEELKAVDPKTARVEDWDYVMCLPTYMKLIDEYGFGDTTTSAERKRGVISMDANYDRIMKRWEYDEENDTRIEVTNTAERKYYFYATGKVLVRAGDYEQILQRIQIMKSWRDFETLFQIAEKHEQKFRSSEDRSGV